MRLAKARLIAQRKSAARVSAIAIARNLRNPKLPNTLPLLTPPA